MKIALTDTGKDDKQRMYLEWMQTLAPAADVIVYSRDKQTPKEIEQCDGLVLTGGSDVDPSLYGQSVGEYTKGIDRQRDEFELLLIEHALKSRKPILGICRGLQIANVYFGGTLHQDLSSQGFLKHAGGKEEPVMEHNVCVVKNSMISEIVNCEQGVINSYHHQGVDRPGNDLTASGYSPDNVVESIEWKEKSGKPFLLLVQWHPERMIDRTNPFVENIGKRFIKEIQNSISY